MIDAIAQALRNTRPDPDTNREWDEGEAEGHVNQWRDDRDAIAMSLAKFYPGFSAKAFIEETDR